MAKTPNTTTAPTGNIAPFGLRMLPNLREQIESAAKANGRSMNAEIAARLDESFLGKADVAILQEAINEVKRELQEISRLRQFLQDVEDRKGDADIGE